MDERLNTYEILRVLVGSHSHGLATPDSDYDYRAVFLVPTQDFLTVGTGKVKATQWIEGIEDNTSYELGHFLALSLQSNPSVLEVYHAPLVDFEGRLLADEENSQLGASLRDLFPYVWSSEKVYYAFTGYGHNQQKKMLDMDVPGDRKWKYAVAHIRVLLQGIQLLKEGLFSTQVLPPWQQVCKEVKQGLFTTGSVIDMVEGLKKQIEIVYKKVHKEANHGEVNRFLLKVRKEHFDVV